AAAASAAPSGGYVVTPLVSNNHVPGTTDDGNLQNAWGLAATATSPWWVADNGSGLSTLYTGAGARLGLVVTGGDAPAGLVANPSTTAFVLPNGSAARFLFDSEAGTVSGWNSATAAVPVLSPPGAVFKGLAVAETTDGTRLYATDFANGRVDVWDGNWQP